MSPLPRLSVLGNRLVTWTATGPVPVRLKGLNRSGFQHRTSLQNAGMPDPQAEVRAWRQGWHAQVIRFPVAADTFLFSESYRDDLDRMVVATEREGVYLILECHGNRHDLSARLPPPEADELWTQLAVLYGDRPHVAFDLFNEPHDVTWNEWRTRAAQIIGAVRGAGATETLVVIAGLDWCYDLSPLLDLKGRLDGQGPLAYATHPYPLKGHPPHGRPQWEAAFGRVAAQLPVLVTEYGADETTNEPYGLGSAQAAEDWLHDLLGYVDELQLCALAWSAGDRPHVALASGGRPVDLPDAAPDPGQATQPFGAVVRAWMMG